jgi:sec-independent protein translocase protein TatA
MFGIGLPELIVVLVLALLVLGPQRLPEAARMLGRGYAYLRQASEEFQNTIKQDVAAMDRQEDSQQNRAVAQEIRERFATVPEAQTTISLTEQPQDG